jgi:hypothetical protein
MTTTMTTTGALPKAALALLASGRGGEYAALQAAGFDASGLLALGLDIPKLANPYTQILEDIHAGQREHDQTTFGPDADPGTNLRDTPMCTAGHLINLAGDRGYSLARELGSAIAARLIHEETHPEWPCQSFENIPEDAAFAYIEEMAAREAAEAA